MKETTLLTIKSEIRKFHKLIISTIDTAKWSQPHYTLLSVLVQNMSFSGKNAHGYNYQKEVDELFALRNLLREYADYYQSYFEEWIASEVEMIIMGNDFMEDVI